jgi:hypothetical protein
LHHAAQRRADGRAANASFSCAHNVWPNWLSLKSLIGRLARHIASPYAKRLAAELGRRSAQSAERQLTGQLGTGLRTVDTSKVWSSKRGNLACYCRRLLTRRLLPDESLAGLFCLDANEELVYILLADIRVYHLADGIIDFLFAPDAVLVRH